MKDRTTWALAGVGLLAAIALVAVFWFGRYEAPLSENVSPHEGKPGEITHPTGWESKTESGITFLYPPTLDTTYIHTTDWPPTLAVSDEAFTCVPAGLENESGGITAGTWLTPEEPACVTLRSEGAAGSTYRLYAYAIPRGEGQFILTFGLRYPQCMNYDEPEQGACQAEQHAFNPDALVGEILGTFSSR